MSSGARTTTDSSSFSRSPGCWRCSARARKARRSEREPASARPPDTAVHFARGAFATAFGLTLVILFRRTLRSPPGAAHWIGAAGWSTLALLVASAWLVPWYAVWLVPLAALSESRRLLAA